MSVEKFRVYRYRWVVLLAYSFVFFVTGPLWIALAPISSTVRQAFFLSGVSDLDITLLVVGPLMVEIFVSMPLGALVDRKGWKFVTGLGALIAAVVGVLRAFSPDINWLLLSQFIFGISFACMFVSVAKLAVNWFPRKEGAFAQGIGLISCNAGNMAGLIFTPLLIGLFGEFAPLVKLTKYSSALRDRYRDCDYYILCAG